MRKTNLKNTLKKTMALTLAAAMMFSTAACGKEDSVDSGKTYTDNQYMEASPLNWNPHSWETNGDSVISTYCEMGFVDTTIAEDGVNFKWVYEMATAIEDITASFADKEKWGVPADATSQYVYKITLNPDAKWEDGTPINADSYIYSMQQCLDPQMKNYRANSYYDGTIAIYNAKNYFNNDKDGQPKYATLASAGFASASEAADAGKDLYVDLTGFWGVSAEDGSALLLPITDDTMYRDPAVAEGEAEDYVSAKYLYETYLQDGAPYAGYAPDYMQCVVGTYETTPWENVGLLKTGDYELTYILQDACSEFYFLSNMTGNWIVKEDIYEAGKETIEGLVATKYGTSVDTYASYGPYKLVSFEKDKQFVMAKNENWYGYTDGKHEGQYMTTHVQVDIISEHNTALQLFNQGKLDNVALTADDMATYRMSDYLLKTDETYTMRFIFATDLAKLKALEEQAGDGSNKRVLYYDDFRKAMSLSIDRSRFVAEATSGFKPAYFLLNSLYYYDIENDSNSIYRNTEEAKKAVLDLYGITYGNGGDYATVDEAYQAVTGYDVEEAKVLFQSVYEQAKKDGNYTDGQKINLTFMVSAADALTAEDTKQQDLLNEFVTAATKGTGFEGKITVTFKAGAKDRYADVAAGLVEGIRGAWGGAAYYPFSTIRVYCEPEYMGGVDKIHESCGWDPTKEKLSVTYDFNKDGKAETVEDTFQNWALSINGSGAYANDMDASLNILSALETGILEAYQCIPVGTYTACELYSMQVEYATLNYNLMYAYGGTRLKTYNYDDAAWEEYVASQGGTLNYE